MFVGFGAGFVKFVGVKMSLLPDLLSIWFTPIMQDDISQEEKNDMGSCL